VGLVNPYLFVVGCPRSGTTLLRRLLDAHPELAVVDETRWIDHWHAWRGVSPGGVTRELVDRLLAHPRFGGLGLTGDDVLSLLDDGPVSYPAFVSKLFDLYGLRRGKELVGDKTPRYCRSISLLHRLFPRARFVHLIRDGRSTALSVVNWRKAEKLATTFETWKEHPVGTAALWWEWQVRLAREAGAELGPSLYHETRYESLVADPAGELQPLCDFLELPFDEAMLRYHEGRTRRGKGLSAKSAWLPPTAGLRDWRAEMSAGDVELFEAASGDLLDELGYSRAYPEPGRESRTAAARIRRAFLADLRALGRPVPWAWERRPAIMRRL
jgi:Sulfotransferase family